MPKNEWHRFFSWCKDFLSLMMIGAAFMFVLVNLLNFNGYAVFVTIEVLGWFTTFLASVKNWQDKLGFLREHYFSRKYFKVVYVETLAPKLVFHIVSRLILDFAGSFGVFYLADSYGFQPVFSQLLANLFSMLWGYILNRYALFISRNLPFLGWLLDPDSKEI